jgi:hypothetical protein
LEHATDPCIVFTQSPSRVVSGVIAFTILLLVLLGMAWGFRTLFLGLITQSAERGNIIPVSMTLARVRVPVGEQFVLSVPARRVGEPLWRTGSFVLTSGRVRLVRLGHVIVDVPLSQIGHLTVQGWTLRLTVRGVAEAIVLRVAQPAVLARYIRCLAIRLPG